ncbi:MAG: OmpA family protein [Phenylobacterium sp.]|uniref:OmpA family protein n=1 Tax=Phenylobacterium sp. TaxID=1871053 RepID=UPI001A51EF82|nr:OmpA family protein [Phenylobacterium sp.]MBL8556824.1 OmpA family protein [Phenylobacterium sp.]
MITTRHLVLAAAALSLAACATKTKTPPGSGLAEAPSAGAPDTPTPPTGGGPSAGRLPATGQAAFAAEAGDRVFFAFDSHGLEGAARDTLQRQAAWLARNDGPVLIAGSTDERGTREYNLALGARRAAAARDYLAAQGVAANRMQTVSYGKEQPLDPASTEEAWAQNRNAHTILNGR